RLELGLVALRRRRRVGVDVVDLPGVDAGLGDRPTGRPDRTDAAGGGQRDVRGVGRRAVADQLGEDRRAAILRVLQLLEDQDPADFARDEAAAALVERPRGPGGIVVPAGERPHRVEPADERLVDPGLAAAGDHRVGIVAADRLPGFADRVAAG